MMGLRLLFPHVTGWVHWVGIPNYHEIVNALQMLLRKKRLKNFSLLGILTYLVLIG